ncbi:branched-chain amino acid-binding protein [Caldovatus sediminis]|uniref:Branched-chain amino acid-binding protein n=1 Tax=Caldovatus sediminis TaxID=2041189 RepID=A0A8J3EC67_9PROT|nr:ABC transporter substrate-binding protein [Caldovatus sediminis]GGG19544.1 branched-chain amino acid-binding protein [Caldovatus sediminis]
MRQSQGLLRAAALAGALLAPALAAAQSAPGVTADTLRIGSFGALTGPGYLYGRLVMNGVEAVFDQVNARGGVHGRRLVLVREDDRCEPGAAIAATRKLIHQEQVFALIGGGCSNATIAARAEIEQSGIPFLVFASVHDGITMPRARNIFSTALTSTIESQAQLAYALEQGARRIAVVSMRDAWGRARYQPLMEEFRRRGVSPVADEEITPDANDATPQVLRLRQANADAVIMLLYPKPGAVFLRDAARFGYRPLAIGQSGIADPAAFEEQVGVPGATARFVTISMVRYTPDMPEVAPWRDAIQAKYPGDRLSVFNLFGVGAAQVLVEALRRAGPEPTRERLIEALNGIRDFPTDAFGGGITCTPEDGRCNKTVVWIQKEPGGPIRVIGTTTVR